MNDDYVVKKTIPSVLKAISESYELQKKLDISLSQGNGYYEQPVINSENSKKNITWMLS